MVRQIDNLGRVVIPKDIRNALAINQGDCIEFFMDDKGGIVLHKYTSICFVCNGIEDVQRHNQSNLCRGCRGKLDIIDAS